MTFVSVPIQLRAEIDAQFPPDCCCNCGVQGGLTLVPTRLTKTVFLGFGGYEKGITVSLPYCSACKVTARRFAPGLGTKLLLSLLTYVALLLAFAVLGFSGVLPTIESTGAVLAVLAGLALVLVFGVYSLRRPRGAQTSWYQPVRLLKMRQRFLDGAIVGWVFGFTNLSYRQRFSAANAATIARGTIEARAL